MDILKIKSCTGSAAINLDQELYRYYSGCRLEKMISSKELFFSNVEKQFDRHERMIPSSFFDKKTSKVQVKTADEKQKRVKAYVTCWTLSEDDYAFWKIYGKDNDCNVNGGSKYAQCMVATTYKELKDSFAGQAEFYEVEYINPKTQKRGDLPIVSFDASTLPTSVRVTEKYKIAPYRFEREIRGVLYSFAEEKGISLPICPEKLIKYIMISPFANDKISKRTEAMIRKFLPDVEIKPSII